MAAERIRALRDVYAAWAEGDFRAGGDLLADDVQFVPLDRLTAPESVRGREAVARFMSDLFGALEDFRVEAREFVDEGDRLLVRVQQLAVGRASGAKVQRDYWMEWVFGDDGKVVRFGAAEAPRRPADVFREMVDAFNEGGLETAVPYYHEDAVLVENPESPEAGEYLGRDAVVGFLRRFLEDFDDFSMELAEFHDVGADRLIAVARYRGRGRTSGAEVDASEAWLVSFRGRQIARAELHRDLAAARAAVA
jgi:ketosteroid isomerase-like protein